MSKERLQAAISKTALEVDFDRMVSDRFPEAAEASQRLRATLMEGGVLFGGEELPTSLKPLFVEGAKQRIWADTVERFLATLSKVVLRYVDDPAFYDAIMITPRGREIAAIDPGYDTLAVTCRPDALVTGDCVALLELNTDSPAMMTCADHVERVQRGLFPMPELAATHEIAGCLSRTSKMLDGTLDAYRSWGGKKSHPTIAIVDWSDEATLQEQELTAAAFRERGCPTVLSDPRELSIREGQLCARGEPIDIVQRRVLAPDFISRAAELETLLSAYRDGLICLVNSLRSGLLGSKVTLAWIESIRGTLNPEEQQALSACLPTTRLLAEVGLDTAIVEKERWVLKPHFGHGGRGVLIGATTDEDTWRAALGAAEPEWIVQELAPPMFYDLPRLDGDQPSSASYYVNWNPFFFGGKFGGAIGRASTEPVVNIRAGGALLPVIEGVVSSS